MHPSRLILRLFAAVAALTLPTLASAAFFVVDSTGDQANPSCLAPGDCTLRTALSEAANTPGPDVIIVQNPNRPPTQDNIKQVVEMKFPPDPHNREQLEDYAAIAGNKNKIVEMKPSDCDCGQENQRSKVPVEQVGWAAAIAGGVMFVLTRGRSPRPMIPAY